MGLDILRRLPTPPFKGGMMVRPQATPMLASFEENVHCKETHPSTGCHTTTLLGEFDRDPHQTCKTFPPVLLRGLANQ